MPRTTLNRAVAIEVPCGAFAAELNRLAPRVSPP